LNRSLEPLASGALPVEELIADIHSGEGEDDLNEEWQMKEELMFK
jgi:hypothetical protein